MQANREEASIENINSNEESHYNVYKQEASDEDIHSGDYKQSCIFMLFILL